MREIQYFKLNEANADDFLILLNKNKVREHLIHHDSFTVDSVKAWIDAKMEIDATEGCRVRAIIQDNQLIGWCGIQPDKENYEIAIIIDDQFWGVGIQVFSDLMNWAKELGHQEVFIHLLHSRPEYNFLRKMSKNIYESEMLGSRFTTYQLQVK